MDERKPRPRILEGLGKLPRPFVPRDEAAATAGHDEGRDVEAEAYERGFEEGFEAGRRKAGEDFESQAERLRGEIVDTLRDLGGLRERIKAEYAALLKDLALEAASQIVRARVAADDPVALRALQAAMDALPGQTAVCARLHPDDLPTIERELGEEIERRRIELVSDTSISRGGCIVKSPSGTIDARLETAMEAVRGAVEDRPEAR